MFNKFIAITCAFFFSVSPFNCAAETDEKPNITSSAYVLYNPEQDEIVDSKNADNKMYPASLTKMLTALTVMDLCVDLDNEMITVSENAVKLLYGTGSSNAGVKVGETFTVRQMLYLMLLPSGNDAANAFAEHFDRPEKSFVSAMNEKAKSIGMNNSNFVNPHGLHDDNHYSTAADLAVLADAYMSVPLLYDIAKCSEYTVPQTNRQPERIIRTTNLLKNKNAVYYYKYATGLKTGNTDKAGRCLAASAEKNGVKYICILLDTPMAWDRYGMVRVDFQEAKAVFEYAFKTYQNVKIASKSQFVTELPVYETKNSTVEIGLKEDVYATLPKDVTLGDITLDYSIDCLRQDGMVDSPVKKGETFGKAKLVLDNRVIGECEVVALEDVKADALLVFWHKIDLYVYIVAYIILFIAIVFVLLVVRKKVVLYKRKIAKQKRLEKRKKMFEDFQNREPIDYFKMD